MLQSMQRESHARAVSQALLAAAGAHVSERRELHVPLVIAWSKRSRGGTGASRPFWVTPVSPMRPARPEDVLLECDLMVFGSGADLTQRCKVF